MRLIQDLPEHFLIMNGDVLTDLDFASFYNKHFSSNRLFTISSHRREQKIDYGVLVSDEGGLLRAFQEKPSTRYEVSMGIYMASREILSYIPDKAYGFDNLIVDLLAANRQICVQPFDGYWFDIGRPDDYVRAIDEFDRLKMRFLHE